jgi:hypothetical protein
MANQKLRFHARGEALVQDFERLDLGIKKFLGWRFAPSTDGGSTAAFEATGEVAEVPYRAEYVLACKAGDLWPADLETARACGVPFDPKFGASAPAPAPAPDNKPAVKAEKAA